MTTITTRVAPSLRRFLGGAALVLLLPVAEAAAQDPFPIRSASLGELLAFMMTAEVRDRFEVDFATRVRMALDYRLERALEEGNEAVLDTLLAGLEEVVLSGADGLMARWAGYPYRKLLERGDLARRGKGEPVDRVMRVVLESRHRVTARVTYFPMIADLPGGERYIPQIRAMALDTVPGEAGSALAALARLGPPGQAVLRQLHREQAVRAPDARHYLNEVLAPNDFRIPRRGGPGEDP